MTKLMTPGLAKHTLLTDILVRDMPNYPVKAGVVHFHNQGGTNVTIEGSLLYPDDILEVAGNVEEMFRINFGLDYDFNQDIANYPCLRSGNKLVVNRMVAKDEQMRYIEPYYRLIRSNTVTVDALSGINVNVALGDPNGSNVLPVTGSSTGLIQIPAGALRVTITVAGRVVDGDENNSATVLGQTWHVGRSETIPAHYDRTTNSYKKLGAITINGNGGRVFYTYQM